MSFENQTISGRNRAEYTFDQGINLAVIPQKDAYPKATAVKIDVATGKLDAALAANDIPYGVIVAPCRKADEKPTVITPFSAVIAAKATAAVVVGDVVYFNGFDATDKITKVTKATTQLINGIVLSAGAQNAEVRVGVLITPITKGT